MYSFVSMREFRRDWMAVDTRPYLDSWQDDFLVCIAGRHYCINLAKGEVNCFPKELAPTEIFETTVEETVRELVGEIVDTVATSCEFEVTELVSDDEYGSDFDCDLDLNDSWDIEPIPSQLELAMANVEAGYFPQSALRRIRNTVFCSRLEQGPQRKPTLDQAFDHLAAVKLRESSPFKRQPSIRPRSYPGAHAPCKYVLMKESSRSQSQLNLSSSTDDRMEDYFDRKMKEQEQRESLQYAVSALKTSYTYDTMQELKRAWLHTATRPTLESGQSVMKVVVCGRGYAIDFNSFTVTLMCEQQRDSLSDLEKALSDLSSGFIPQAELRAIRRIVFNPMRRPLSQASTEEVASAASPSAQPIPLGWYDHSE